MATTMRSLDTRFWSDVWVRKLNALDRYFFLYLLTNQHSTWCGVYELDIGMMAFESGIDENDIKRTMLPRLSPKILYIDGWVYIVNFKKYHENRSEKTKKGIDNAWSEVPEDIRLKINEITESKIPHQRGMDGVSPSSLSLSSSLSLAPMVCEVPSQEEFSLIGEIHKMEESPRRDINIIAMYLEERKPDIRNKEQLQIAIKRHLRPAKDLISFTDNQILDALPKAKKSTPDFTLETLIKMLTK